MLIQEYVLFGKFTFLLRSTTALTIALFILAQLLLEATRNFNYSDKKGEKTFFSSEGHATTHVAIWRI